MSTIKQELENYLQTVQTGRSKNTAKSYRMGINSFVNSLQDIDFDLDQPVTALSPSHIIPFISYSKERGVSVASERLYLTAITGFYQYLMAQDLALINMDKVRLIIKQYGRREGRRIPSFPKKAVEAVISYAEGLVPDAGLDKQEKLIIMRNRTFILTLADTGLRVSEACNLKRGDINYDDGQAIVIGKGDKQAVVRFSTRSLVAIKDYLRFRSELDGASGQPLVHLPLFAKHNINAKNTVSPISSQTGEDIVAQMVVQALGAEEAELYTITPHTFRHRFVTEIVQQTGNIKLAQGLARHSSIAVTERYTHLTDHDLDNGFSSVFEN